MINSPLSLPALAGMPGIACRLALALIVTVLTAAVALGEPPAFTLAKDAFDRGVYGQAREQLQALANTGDSRAMFYLAVIYERGLGVGAESAKAFFWYEQAALNGHPEAQYNLGNAFKHGRDAVKSDELATYWWRKAADSGQPNAQYNLALQYYTGAGVEKDTEKAVTWFRKAAGSGHSGARKLLDAGKIPDTPQQPAVELRSGLPAPGGDRPAGTGEPDRRSEQRSGKAKLRFRDADWLSRRDPKHFTIQLAAMINPANLASFLAANGVGGQVNVVAITRDNKTLYHVLVGNFADADQARNGLDALKPQLKALQPWARPFAELQHY